jgi:hypothetical protein
MTTGDFNLNARYMAIEGEVKAAMGSADAGSGSDHQHYPYARQVRISWYQDAAGKWAYQGVDEHLWEVFCEQCGDTDSPAESQAPAVLQLRGPYQRKHSAEHAANKHFKAFRAG